jgi:hypothetical protein
MTDYICGSILICVSFFKYALPRLHLSRRCYPPLPLREFTHRDPDFVFWIYPDGKLCNAHNSHLKNPPRGFEHILNDEPRYGGFLRGRVASLLEDQIIVVYCEEDALAHAGKKLIQFLRGVGQLPVIIRDDALVISDNGDIYGTLDDLVAR